MAVRSRHANIDAKYLKVADSLGKKIESNEFESRLPTLIELAEHFDTTVATMQKAVGVLKDRKLIRAVPRQGLYVSALRRPRTNVIGAVTDSLNGPLGNHLAFGLQNTAASFAYGLNIQSIDCLNKVREGASRQLETVRQVVDEQQVDGLVLWLRNRETTEQAVEFLENENFPFVLVPEVDITRFSGCHTVTNSDSGAAGNVMTHLIGLGHKKIGFVVNKNDSEELYSIHRYAQYCQSMKSIEQEPLERIVIDPTGNEDASALKSLMQCTAVFCCTDRDAFCVLRICLNNKISVPGELAVAGYDNVDIDQTLGLTSVEQHYELIGQKAVELLMDELEGRVDEPQHLTVESELVIRASTVKRPKQKIKNLPVAKTPRAVINRTNQN